MSNPDVAGIEACKRLANKVSLPDSGEECWWWLESLYDEPRLTYCCHGDKLPTHIYTRAPTIGEMLAYIRRRGWKLCHFHEQPDGYHVCVVAGESHYEAVAESPANALANALSEAVEKEGAVK